MRTCVCLFIFLCVFFCRTSGSKYICDCVYVVQVERGIGLWCYWHFQQYVSYIMVVSFIAGENHRPTASRCQIHHIMLHRVHMTMSRIRTHNFSPSWKTILKISKGSSEATIRRSTDNTMAEDENNGGQITTQKDKMIAVDLKRRVVPAPILLPIVFVMLPMTLDTSIRQNK